MCGRLTLTAPELRDIAALLGAELVAEDARDYRPRYNVAPGQSHWVLRADLGDEKRHLVPARFGMRSKLLGDKLMPFNARSDKVLRVAAFREALSHRRVVVPADGYYEWVTVNGKKHPLRFTRADGAPILFAAICEDPPAPGKPAGDIDPRKAPGGFAILTVAATGELSAFHDRVPVILEADEVDSWLSTGKRSPVAIEKSGVLGLLHGAKDGTVAWQAASMRVGSVANDDPACLVAEADAPSATTSPEEPSRAKSARAGGSANKKGGGGAGPTGGGRQLTLF